MSLPRPKDDAEAEILDFLRSRPRVTYAEVALACSASDWKRSNYLRALRRSGHLKPCARDGAKQYYTIMDEHEANRLAATSDQDALAAEWSAQQLRRKLNAPEIKAVEPATATGGFNPYQRAIWTYVSGLNRFTKDDVARTCPGPEAARENFLRQLAGKGMIFTWGRVGATTYYTTRDPARAQEKARAARRSMEGEIWTAMRIQKSFTALDLHAALHPACPDLTQRQVQDYCSLLTKAGYLRALRKARHNGPAAAYRLVRDTGPLPPTSHRVSVVIDGNDDRIVYAPRGRLA